MSPTGSGNLPRDPGPRVELNPVVIRRIPIHDKAGFLWLGGQVVAYRYSEETGQLSITNLDGGAVLKPLSDNHAKTALEAIHQL